MRKFKLIATAVLASALTLSGCGKEQEPEEPEHSHVDANNDYVCDECGAALTGVESVSIVCEDSVAEKEQIELKANVKVHGVAKDVSWSVVNGTGTAEIVTEEGKTYLKGLTEGTVTVKAVSTVDSSKFSEKEISVYSLGFAPDLIELGFTYSKTFPVAELKEMFGNEATIFEPSAEITSRGMYFRHIDATEKAAETFMLIYNLDASKALEDAEIARIGSKLDSEYYGAEYLYSFELEDGNVGFIDNTFTYEFDTTFISTYYGMYWYHVSDFYADETKTENEDWTDAEKEDMRGMLEGETIPFIKMGASYEIESSMMGGYINAYDNSCDYRITEAYKSLLVESGFSYLSAYKVYAKKLDENKYLYVESFFDEYGNEIYAYIGSEYLEDWPTEAVNKFVSTTLGSENSVPAFSYESESKVFTFSESTESLTVSTSYCSYDLIEAYITNLISEKGFELVGMNELMTMLLDDPTSAEGKYGGFELQKGYIDLNISINPQYRPDETLGLFPVEFYFDYCSVSFTISKGNGYEVKGIYIDDKKSLPEGEKLQLELGDEFTLDIVGCKLSSEAVISFESSEVGVATVSDKGVITPVSVGDTTITVSAVDEGTTYTDTIGVSVKNKPVYESSSMSDHVENISSLGYSLLEESGVVINVSKGTGEDFVLDSTEGTLTLKEGNVISFIPRAGETITYVGFSGAVSDEAVITPDHGEFVKDGWYATDVENSCTLTVTSGTYTISDFIVYVNTELQPVPSLVTAKTIANEIATGVIDWWMTDSVVLNDDEEDYCFLSFVWTEYTTDSGFSIEEAFESCIDYQLIYTTDTYFELDGDLFVDVDMDGNDYASGDYWSEDGTFYLNATLTADSASGTYLVEVQVMQF